MSKNVGVADQAICVMLGVILLAVGFLHVVSGAWAIAAYFVGAVALVTGVLRFCPAWSVVGINTCRVAHR